MTTNPDSSPKTNPITPDPYALKTRPAGERGFADLRDLCKFRPCKYPECSVEVAYVDIRIPGIRPELLTPEYCETHYEVLYGKAEADLLHKESAKLQERENAIRHAAKWADLCPQKYRTEAEGGETDLSLLSGSALSVIQSHKSYPSPKRPFGLFFHGITDTGKSRVMWRLIRMAFDRKLSILAFNGVNFSHQVAEHFRNGTEYRWLEAIARADLVFFDDLWKFATTERADAELWGIFERRSADGRPIFATTNFTEDVLLARAEQSGSRMSVDRTTALMTRIRQDCEVVAFE